MTHRETQYSNQTAPNRQAWAFRSWLLSGLLLFCVNVWGDAPQLAKASPASQPALQSVSIQLKWHHQFQFAGYYAAIKQGYYRDEGLDVTLKPRNLLENNIEQVLNGASEYGVADSILLLYQARQQPVVIVAPIFQHSPQVLFTLKSSDLNSPYQLNDKRLAFYKADTDGLPILAMFNQLGVAPDMDSVLIDKLPDRLLDKTVEAYAGYLTNEAYYFQNSQVPFNVIHPINYGIDMYGDMLFTTQDEVTQHPERVAKMRRATLKGWQYAMSHKAEMARYILTHYGLNKTYDHLMFESEAIERMMNLETIPIGQLEPGRLRFIVDLFRQQGLLDGEIDFRAGVYQPEEDSLALTPSEKAWIQQHPVLRLGVDRSYAPIEFVDQYGQYSGMTPEFLAYVSQKTGLTFKPQRHLSWSQALTHFHNRHLDMLPAVIETVSRKKHMLFTQPYLEFPMVIATLEGEPYIANFSQLHGKTLAVVKDYAAHEQLRTLFPEATLEVVDTIEDGLKAVSEGAVFGFVDNVAVIGYHLKRTGLVNVQISGEMPFKAQIAIAVRPDWPELVSIMNKVIQQLPLQKRAELTNHWLQIRYKTEYSWQRLALIVTPVVAMLMVLVFLNRQLRQAKTRLRVTNEQLSALSQTDHLTGLYNRQYLDQVLDAEVARVAQGNRPFSLVMMDLDDFKIVNDTYGHLTGDAVLVTSAKALKQCVRSTDVLGRWGGEEFVLICPQTHLAQAESLAEKMRLAVAETTFSPDIQLTLSLGVAEYQPDEPISRCIDRADRNLYRAKHQGKNQVSAKRELDESHAGSHRA
ncbi:MAG: transporter substrate-binding domain-containing diguanylate cyclase [Hydrogenovibrio sp.]